MYFYHFYFNFFSYLMIKGIWEFAVKNLSITYTCQAGWGSAGNSSRSPYLVQRVFVDWLTFDSFFRIYTCFIRALTTGNVKCFDKYNNLFCQAVFYLFLLGFVQISVFQKHGVRPPGRVTNRLGKKNPKFKNKICSQAHKKSKIKKVKCRHLFFLIIDNILNFHKKWTQIMYSAYLSTLLYSAILW